MLRKSSTNEKRMLVMAPKNILPNPYPAPSGSSIESLSKLPLFGLY
jgi:hypothetical protein